LRRSRHSPSRYDKLALAVGAIADDRRHVVGEDSRLGRKVAGAIVLHGEEVADGLLALGDAVEIAHRRRLCGDSKTEARTAAVCAGSRRAMALSCRPTTCRGRRSRRPQAPRHRAEAKMSSASAREFEPIPVSALSIGDRARASTWPVCGTTAPQIGPSEVTHVHITFPLGFP
jgi:hypothetical protein